MTEFRPPAPVPPKERPSLWRMFWMARRCTLSILFERGYSMKMGHIRFPGWNHFMVNEPKWVRHVLVDHADRFPKGEMLCAMMRPLVGDGIFISSGDMWKRQRRMIDPAFEQTRLQTAFPLMMDAVEAMEGRLDALADGAVLRADLETTHVTADVIFRTIFSEPMEADAARRVFAAFERFQDAAPSIGMWRAAGILPWFSVRRMQAGRAAREIRGLLRELIRRRLDETQDGAPREPQDILDSLIAARDPGTGKGFTVTELVDQVAVLFLAGHETTASTLAWTLYLVAMCPEVQDRLHGEALEVMGDRRPEFQDVSRLKYTRDVFRETLRLYPPAPFLPRRSTVTECLRDKTVPPDSAVVVSPWLIHRHRVLWDRPDVFDPDRFREESARDSVRHAYLPFGQGPRVCAGAAFAMQEATLILACLMRRYRFECDPGHTPRPVGRLTVRSENGVALRIHSRFNCSQLDAD